MGVLWPLLRSRQGPQRLCSPRGTLDPAGRRGGGWPPGPRARRRLRPAGFERATLVGSWRSRALARFGCGRVAARRGVWPPALDLAGWASLPSSPAAACRKLALPAPPLRCGPSGAALLCRRDCRSAPAAHPAIPAPVAVVL